MLCVLKNGEKGNRQRIAISTFGKQQQQQKTLYTQSFRHKNAPECFDGNGVRQEDPLMRYKMLSKNIRFEQQTQRASEKLKPTNATATQSRGGLSNENMISN